MRQHSILSQSAEAQEPSLKTGSTLVPPRSLASMASGTESLGASTSESEQVPWRVLGRELVEKTLPSPAKAGAILAAFVGAASVANANAPDAAQGAIQVHRMDLVPLAVMMAALGAVAAVATRIKIPGTARGMSRAHADAVVKDLKSPDKTLRMAALAEVAQDHQRIATALVTPLDALVHVGAQEPREDEEMYLLTSLIAATEQGDYEGPLPKGILNVPGRGDDHDLAFRLAGSESPSVRQFFREEVGDWLADAYGLGEARPNLAAAVSLHLWDGRAVEIKAMLETVERALGQSPLKPGDLGGGPAQAVALVVGVGTNNLGVEVKTFKVATQAAIRFGRDEDMERLSNATMALARRGRLMGQPSLAVPARVIGNAFKQIAGHKDLRARDALRLEDAILAGTKNLPEDVLAGSDLERALADRPLCGLPMATPSEKATFLKAFDRMKGKPSLELASLAHLLRSHPEQGVTTYDLHLGLLEIGKTIEEKLAGHLAKADAGPATALFVRKLGSLEQHCQALGIPAPPALEETLRALKANGVVSQGAARMAITQTRLVAIEAQMRAAGTAPVDAETRKEKES